MMKPVTRQWLINFGIWAVGVTCILILSFWAVQAMAQQPQKFTPEQQLQLLQAELAETRMQREQANNATSGMAVTLRMYDAQLKAANEEVQRLTKLCGKPCEPKEEKPK